MSDSKLYISYETVHKLCQEGAAKLKRLDPEVIIAIGGGGFIPARILRTFLKQKGGKNIPIQAIGLSLYEELTGSEYEEKLGKEVVRTQWLDFSSLSKHKVDLIGKNLLIVDEVDDTRTTLHYAVSELSKDLQSLAKSLGRENEETTISVFVLHNKDKPKNAELPAELKDSGRYIGKTVKDVWIAYPWEAADIDSHTAKARQQEAELASPAASIVDNTTSKGPRSAAGTPP